MCRSASPSCSLWADRLSRRHSCSGRHFGYIVDEHILKFVREFGLILFIFAIGLQVGPGFFSSFKKGGMRLNMLAVLGIALNVVIVLCIYYFGNIHDMTALVGVMSGAVTNTPGLAAAQQTISSASRCPWDTLPHILWV